jgi:hypothetical protein
VFVLPVERREAKSFSSMSIMDQTASVLPRPKRKWLRRLSLALALLVGSCVGGILAFVWFSSFELKALLAEMDRLDPGWRAHEIEAARKVVPDAENSALHIVAIGKLRGGQTVITPDTEKMFENLPPQVLLNEQQAVHLERRFAVLRKTVAEARKLKDMPEGRYPIEYSDAWMDIPCPHLQEAREACELLKWDAVRRAHATDDEGALESCLALQNAACFMGDEPFPMSLFVRVGGNGVAVGAIERTLAQGHFTSASEPTLKLMQDTFARELSKPTLLIALRGKRAGLHQFIQAVDEGKVNAASLGLVPWAPKVDILEGLSGGGKSVRRSLSDKVDSRLTEHFPGYLTRQHAAMLRFANDLVSAAKLPPSQAEERFQTLEKRIPEEPYLVRLTAASFIKMREVERRMQASLRCALAALGAERFRIAQKRWPESLDELVKTGFLDAVPTDPYDGKPIRFKRAVDGLIVYSVGHDKTDNGGAIGRERPFDSGTGQGFRLWDVSRRRQPPNPPMPEGEP